MQSARPLFFRDEDSGDRLAFVVVYSAPLGDVERSVDLVRSRIILAAIVALGLAVLAAYLVAQSLGRRVARLQHVAERVAVGDFSARFPVEGDDELGQLAKSLDLMQRQLAALDSSRRRFIATASHELRTPVFSLGGFLELLEDEDLDEDTRARFLDQVRDQTSRLRKLTTDLLDLSRLDAASVELRLADTDIDDLAQTVTEEFAPALDEHESNLSLTPAGEPMNVVCDPDRVAQIMRILIDNAITHTPPGTAVAVSTSRDERRRDDRRDGLRTGRPACRPAARLRALLHVHGTRGSGLGLTIARDLAERMGGELTLNSRPGNTTFSLRIPSSPPVAR